MSRRPIVVLYLICTLLFTSSCSRQSTEKAQGYIQGRYTYMATSVSGRLMELPVTRGMRVKQGQLLFVLQARPELDAYKAELANLKQAVASRDAIAANLVYAKKTYERYKILVPKNAIQESSLDNAKSTYDATVAQLEQANAAIATSAANLAQSEWNKDQKSVYAPVDSLVFDTYYRLGEYTTANQAVLSLLAPEDIKVVFFIPEAYLGAVHLNDAVTVHCNGCKQDYVAHIRFIAPNAEYTPPVIYSTETSPKLIYRIEAAFSKEDAYQMHPGQPVIVMYSTHG